MPEMREIYNAYSGDYDELLRCEDCDKNLSKTLYSVCDFNDKIVLEAGVGTGRVTAIYAKYAKKIIATDISEHMLAAARKNLSEYAPKIQFEVKDNLKLNELQVKVDVFIEGWSFGHAVENAQENKIPYIVEELINQVYSVLKPAGKIIIIETLGTCNKEPKSLFKKLNIFYGLLEEKYGFTSKQIQTDYLFESVDDAARIIGFFFGKTKEDWVKKKGSTRVPETTGMWIKNYKALL